MKQLGKQTRSWSFPKVETKRAQSENAATFKHHRRLRAKLFEYNEVGMRYVDPLKVAPKLGSCRDKHAHVTYSHHQKYFTLFKNIISNSI